MSSLDDECKYCIVSTAPLCAEHDCTYLYTNQFCEP